MGTTGQLLLTIILGLVLVSNEASSNVEDYENSIIDFMLVGSSVVVFLISMYMMVTGIYEKCMTAKQTMGKRTKLIFYILMCQCLCCCFRKKKKQRETQVVPMDEEKRRKMKQLQEMESLRQIRIKYGAASPEYQAALAAFRGTEHDSVAGEGKEAQIRLNKEKAKQK